MNLPLCSDNLQSGKLKYFMGAPCPASPITVSLPCGENAFIKPVSGKYFSIAPAAIPAHMQIMYFFIVRARIIILYPHFIYLYYNMRIEYG